MTNYKILLSKLNAQTFDLANKILPKLNRVVVSGNNTIESNAVEVANFIAENTLRQVYFIVSKEYKFYTKEILSSKIKLVDSESYYAHFLTLTSRYIFSTHNPTLNTSKRQLEINLWHGLLYKNIRLLRGENALPADITVGTSPLSQKMFSEAFGVTKKSIVITGYPRNDMMIRAKKNQLSLKEKIGDDFQQYSKILFWMPTYRREDKNDTSSSFLNMKSKNPFQINNFDIKILNEILKEHNALCLLKPHYYYMSSNYDLNFSNIKMIDDVWIAKKGITLYDLLGVTDILISDFSSVMYDYTLLDQPIICFCTDVEDYKKTQGLYFEDIENWLPSKLIQDQTEFFDYLSHILKTTEDIYHDKRKKIKKLAFTYHDSKSTQRLIDVVFNKLE